MQFIDTTFSSLGSRLSGVAGTRAGQDQESCSLAPEGRASVSANAQSADFLIKGGIMNRFLIALLACLGLFGLSNRTEAQYLKIVGGYLPAGQTNVFHSRVPANSAQDTIYEISGDYDISGTLTVMEGAEVWFLPNSRIVDSTCGKIIANGFTGLNRRIEFRGIPINANSFEWGHFLVLPGADSVFFANVRFVNFRKRTSVDNTQIFSGNTPASVAYNLAIDAAANGNGGVIATFSHKTYLYDVIVDSCQTSFRGGAFAFLQAPAATYGTDCSAVPNANDDGRLALANNQVQRLTIRNTRCYNNETGAYTDRDAAGGAIYMASNTTTQSSSNFVVAHLGNRSGYITAANDVMLFDSCSANNVIAGSALLPQRSKGGAIYVGSNTGLIVERATFNNDSAVNPIDSNAWGGAIAVSSTSGNPNQVAPGVGITPGADRLAGLAILKTATFNGNVAGLGGAIYIDHSLSTIPLNPVLNIDGENFVGSVRDSGLIQFTGNIAYLKGGAVYSTFRTFITGYLAYQGYPFGGGSQSVELRVKFFNNVAGEAGGSICLDGFQQTGAADIQNRRVWQLQNSVNPRDPRVSRPNYVLLVLGGGAEFIGNRDSTFATEYNGNFVEGGSGGAVAIVDPSGVSGSSAARFFVENGYNAQNVPASSFPFDPRELTRFINNHAYLGTAADSAQLYHYNTVTPHGCGGGVLINITNKGLAVLDTANFSRVRFEMNDAFTGSAIYSDNFNLKLLTDLCLVANNNTTSPFSRTVDLDATGISNPSDSNASATIWGDFEGPLPAYESNSRGDAVYDNQARYLLRLPTAPGAGALGIGGTDTARGIFWGESGPSVITQINPPAGAEQATFFVDFYKGCFTNVYEPNRNPPSGYVPVPIGTIQDTLLMEGRVYDIFDKGTDMRALDYGNRRLAPAESFALGIPNDVASVHRFTRNFFDTDPTYVSKIDQLQADFQGNHPLGYPLFLQANISATDSNRDDYAKNYSVLMVFNTTTNEFVRVNAKETVASEAAGSQQIYQGRLDFVPDSSVTERHANSRERALYTLSLLRPQTMTYAEVQRASKLEDSAALDGREYSLSPGDLVGSVSGDTICTQGFPNSATTWYAGERYHTLPVRPGDGILVISRTLLWKYGAAYAIAHGLSFSIGDIMPPAFTGDVPSLQSDPYNPNRRFVHEDVNYNGATAATTLFRVGGYDANAFYDPRFLFSPGAYTQLALTVNVDTLPGDTNRAHVRLNHWMHQATVFNQNVGGSNGYILLTGQPHNPDVVPGGEGVTATLMNFPPNYASENALETAFDSSVLGPDHSNLSLWAFPPYMNCASGFLQDTLCVRSSALTYHFRIFVEDSLPVFTSSPSTACAANLTDSLRYTYDLQTDDESEDSAAAAEIPAWDFRYGKTSYSLLERPLWMQQIDGNGKFISSGVINVRLDSATAVRFITPAPQVNGELNLDTVVTVQVDDGHTGKAVQTWRIPINVAPTITTTALPNAKEGIDYSLNFQNPLLINRINIYDPNFADYHTYSLLYEGDTQTVYRDAHYGVGATLLTGTTPRWLHIDPFSGVLTGTPGINDAPRTATTNCGGPDTVTVIVVDQCGLMAWTTLTLPVDSTQHVPAFIRGQRTICVTNNTSFCDSSVRVADLDLLRLGCTDNLTVTLVNPVDTPFTVTPTIIRGPGVTDTAIVNLCGTYHFSGIPPSVDSIRIAVTDIAGNTDTLVYAVHIGDVPTFECAIDVSNAVTGSHPLEDIQHLCFGAGRSASDSLDIRYCEFEVPPPPYQSTFDARWELPIGGQIEGTFVDVRRDTNLVSSITWQVRFNSGSESGGNLYPMEICWSKACLDPTSTALVGTTFATGHFYLRQPQNSNEFSIDMFTGKGIIDNSLYTLVPKGSDTLCLQIRDVNLRNALIVFQPAKSGVDPVAPGRQFAIEPNYPNPFSSSTTLNFTVAERSNVRIDIYDVKGTLVRTLVNEDLDPGTYPVTWDATDASGTEMPSGSYIARMTAGSFASTVKMSLTKMSK
jgi:predicted outer membrane repeat protein